MGRLEKQAHPSLSPTSENRLFKPPVNNVSYSISAVLKMARRKSAARKSHVGTSVMPVPAPDEAHASAVQKTGKATKRVAKGDKRSYRKKKSESFKTYVYKVLKQVHPVLGISSKAMTVMNSFMIDSFERIASEAARLARIVKRRTLSARDFQSAVQLILPGELSKHAVSEGTKAVAMFHKSKQ